jgi:hypothetical protein
MKESRDKFEKSWGKLAKVSITIKRRLLNSLGEIVTHAYLL